MKRVLFVLLLSACGGADDNHGYGYEYDYIDNETGLRIRYSELVTKKEMPPSTVLYFYKTIQECSGYYADGPLIIVVDDLPERTGNQLLLGITFSNGTIVLDNSGAYYLASPFRRVIVHEMLHYLLYANGDISSANLNHEHPLFISLQACFDN